MKENFEKSLCVTEYHYCDLGSTHIGCRPGSNKVCDHLKGLSSAQGVTCPHFIYRKENELFGPS